MIGETLDGRYRLERLLGSGGMGQVYEATHLGTGRRVAVKLIREIALGESDVFHRFEREARASSAMDTRHIVQVLDSGRDPTTKLPFMAMDLLRGRDVGALIEARGALDANLALRIVAQASLGLAKAHAAGVVHRDIKPANLFLAEEEDDEIVVKLLDFGIAKVRPLNPFESAERHLTQTGRLLGTPLYMSPEQAEGARDVDHRSDIWSLGCVLYEALTGKPPHHHAETLGKLIVAITTKPVAPPSTLNPKVSFAIDMAVMQALAIERDERYATADAMLEALTVLLPDGGFISQSEVNPGRVSFGTSSPKLHLNRPRSERNLTPAPGLGATRPLSIPAEQERSASGRTSVPDAATVGDEVGVASTLFASNLSLHGAGKSRRSLLIAAGALSGLAIVTSLAFLLTRQSEPATAASSSATATATEVVTQAATVTARCPTLKLAVDPTDANVLVGGKSAVVDANGSVEIEGCPGGESIVTISKGETTRKIIVEIGDGTATPARLTLTAEPLASASTSAPSSGPEPIRKGGLSGPRPGASPPPATASGPRVNRVFD